MRAGAVVALLAAYGYSPHHITRDGHMGTPFTLEEMLRVTIATNVLFVRGDIRDTRPGIVPGTRLP
jgi:hypothetical protein